MKDIVVFPGPFILVYEVKNHLKIKSKILSYIKNLDELNVSDNFQNLKTSYYNSKNNDFEKKILNDGEIIDNVVWEPIDYFLENNPFFIQSKPENSILRNMWFNYYENDSFFSTHTHPGSTFSGIYLLHLEEKNNTEFYFSGSGNSNYQYVNYRTEHITEGHVILFPSEVFHSVPKVNSKKITISFNVNSY